MKLNHTLTLSAISLLGLLTVGCTNSDNPQLSMCQAVAKQLTSNTISGWGDTSQSDDNRSVTSKVAFTTNDGQAGNLSCVYKKDNNGIVDTGPRAVTFNGQAVPNKILISASVQATKELLAGTYNNTVAKSQELAAEAGAVAGVALDAAGKAAKEVAGEVEKALQNGTVLKIDK